MSVLLFFSLSVLLQDLLWLNLLTQELFSFDGMLSMQVTSFKEEGSSYAHGNFKSNLH